MSKNSITAKEQKESIDDEGYQAQRIFSTSVSQSRNHDLRAFQDIYERLPMFKDKILYPEFDPSLKQYKHEATLLTIYMRDVYRVMSYKRD